MNPETRLEIAALHDMTIDQLIAKYEDVFDEECRSRHRRYLLRRIALRAKLRPVALLLCQALGVCEGR